ncbi:MAG: Xaa-Pro peptidase family protein [Ignavibacteria bacterium]|nr:Xaa-Pro peptidase family protein [Ignavibacteria bacterium]
MTSKRIARVRQELRNLRLDAFLVTALPHVRYLTGFSGTNGLSLITPRRHLFFSDSRYKRQAQAEVHGATHHITQRELIDEAGRTAAGRTPVRIGFEAAHCTVMQHRLLRKSAGKSTLVPTTGVMEQIVAVKERDEVSAITRALRISERVLDHLLPMIRPGVSELDLAAEISYQHKRFGADGDAFPPLVASGARSAFPHAKPTGNRIRSGQIVLLDFGCSINGYNSDMTRTVVVGRVPAGVRKMYSAVLEARDRAIDAIRPGIRASVIDGVARRVLDARGLGELFVHSLGHGVGLSVHERPRISSLSSETLESGYVVTIEPGVYRPGVGGIRIEDIVCLTRRGSRVLTKAGRTLLVV